MSDVKDWTKLLDSICSEVTQKISEIEEGNLAAYCFVHPEPIAFNHTAWISGKLTEGDEASLITMWRQVERLGNDANVATLRVYFNRIGKQILGYPVKVDGRKLVSSSRRNR